MCRDAYNDFRDKILDNTPFYLQPFVWLIKKIFTIALLGLELIGTTLPQIFVIILFLIFWYAIGYPFIMYIEDNPAEINDTINLFVELGKIFWNVIAGIINVILSIVTPILPFTWQFLTGLYHISCLLISFILSILKIEPGIKVGSNFQPFNSINLLVENSQLNTGFNPKANLNSVYNDFDNRRLSSNLYIVEELNVMNRHLAYIEENKVFTKYYENGLYNWGSTGAGVMQLILLYLFYIGEILFSIFYIFVEVILSAASILADVIVGIILIIPKIGCAGANFGCALTEGVVSIINDILLLISKIIPLGTITIPACSEKDLGTIDCQCSLSEGGIFSGLPPCPSSTFECRITKNQITGQTLYGEYKNNNGFPVTQSEIASLGCPNSFRKLSLTEERICHTTCIYTENFGKKYDTYYWEVENCNDGKLVYKGACLPYNVQDDHSKRKLQDINQSIVLKQLHYSKFNQFNNDYLKSEKLKLQNDYNFKTKTKEKEKEQSTTESVQQTFKYIQNAKINDIYYQTHCKKFNGMDFMLMTSTPFSEVIQSSICYFRGLMIAQSSNQSKLKHRNLKESHKNITLNADLWYIGPKEQDQQTTLSKSILTYYIKPFSQASKRIYENNLHPLRQLEEFHDDLIHAHKNYLNAVNPTIKTMVGTSKGFYTKWALNVTNRILGNHVEWSKSNINEKSQRDYFKMTKDDEPGIYRRHLQSNVLNTGEIVSLCGSVGYLCPDGTCAPNGNPKKCQIPQEATIGSVIRSIPHFFLSKFEEIDVRLFFNDVLDCWFDITQNPEKNPVNGFRDGLIKIFDADPTNYPPNIRFCFPMIPPIPTVPYITWSWNKFIAQTFGTNDLSNNFVQQYVCPHYAGGYRANDIFSQWISGVSFSIYSRLYYGLTAVDFLIASVTPAFLSEIWTMFISFFFCNPSVCPAVANFFNYDYASGGQSVGTNVFCIILHSGSMIFCSFFVYVVYIVIFFARRFLWAISSLISDPILYIIMSFFNYLRRINRTYQIKKFTKPQDIEDHVE